MVRSMDEYSLVLALIKHPLGRYIQVTSSLLNGVGVFIECTYPTKAYLLLVSSYVDFA